MCFLCRNRILTDHKVKTFFFYILTALFFTNYVCAQNTLIIKDLETNNPLAGANVRNLLNDQLSISDPDGKIDI